MNWLQVYTVGIVSRTWLISSTKLSLHTNLAEGKRSHQRAQINQLEQRHRLLRKPWLCVSGAPVITLFWACLMPCTGMPKSRYSDNNTEKPWAFLSVVECLQVLWRALNETSRPLHLCLRRKGNLRIPNLLWNSGLGLSIVAFLKCRGMISNLCSRALVLIFVQIFIDLALGFCARFCFCFLHMFNSLPIWWQSWFWFYVTCLGLEGQIKVMFIQKCY